LFAGAVPWRAGQYFGGYARSRRFTLKRLEAWFRGRIDAVCGSFEHLQTTAGVDVEKAGAQDSTRDTIKLETRLKPPPDVVWNIAE
jgi:hypothetical protein